MIRLINAECYKLRKSKNFYICAAVMAAFVLLIYIMLSLADGIKKGDVENGTAGVIITAESTSESIWDDTSIMDMVPQMFSGDLTACVLAVFVTIFVIGEYSSGMIKNVTGKGCSRTAIFLSKLLASVLGSVLITLIGFAAMLLCGQIFIGKTAFDGNILQNFFIYAGLQLCMVAALSAVYVLVGEISRNHAAGISAGIGVAVFPLLFLNGLDILCADSSIVPSRFWIISRSEQCPIDGFTTGYVTQTVLIYILWFAAAAGLGLWHFHKADIK